MKFPSVSRSYRVHEVKVMVVKMKRDATKDEIGSVCEELKKYNIKPDVIYGKEMTVIGMVGDEDMVDVGHIMSLSGVSDVVLMQSEVPYKLVSRKYTESDMSVMIGDIEVGGDRPVYMVGPCAVESRDQLMRITEKIKGISEKDGYAQYVLRGGAFKPTSKPHGFKGIGEDALKYLKEAREQFGMPVVTEATGEWCVGLCAEYADVIQIGARNMYDQDLLIDAGKTGKPILYKRHPGASIQDWMQFAGHIIISGEGDKVNKNVIFCERGINPVGKGKEFSRFPLDVSSVLTIKEETYLPIIVDPSHSAGKREYIADLSLSAMGAGAHGLMIETHDMPEKALKDGRQMVTPDELYVILQSCNEVHAMRDKYRSAWEKVSRTGNDLHVAYI
jgi:3-deoxy-7-phosphoheptulonate synthase